MTKDLYYSDFEKSVNSKKVCNDCKFCKKSSSGAEYTKCTAPKGNGSKYTGFGGCDGDYISIMIKYNEFPNKHGECEYYEPGNVGGMTTRDARLLITGFIVGWVVLCLLMGINK